MARKVFFSFHFDRDIWRVGQVRNAWLTKPDREEAGYWDKAKWEQVKRQGDDAIKSWINNSLNGTSVTVLLIGSETSTRRWVQHELWRSYERGNGMVGITIHNIKDKFGTPDAPGSIAVPVFQQDGQTHYFSELYPVYDWVLDNGYTNIGSWVEQAARQAGK